MVAVEYVESADDDVPCHRRHPVALCLYFTDPNSSHAEMVRQRAHPVTALNHHHRHKSSVLGEYGAVKDSSAELRRVADPYSDEADFIPPLNLRNTSYPISDSDGVDSSADSVPPSASDSDSDSASAQSATATRLVDTSSNPDSGSPRPN